MARVPESNCAIGATAAAAATLEAIGKDGQKYADDLLRFIFNFGKKRPGVNAERQAEALDMATETLLSTVTDVKKRKMNVSWVTQMTFPAKAIKGKDLSGNTINQGLMHQHRLVQGHARAIGQTRSFYGDTLKKFSPDEPFDTVAYNDLVVRLNLHDGYLRTLGIPLVTMNPGGTHVAHLTAGDILGVLAKQSKAGEDFTAPAINSMLRNIDPTENLPMQNLAEAVRRIVENADDAVRLDDEGLALLKADVLDALVYPTGKPASEAAQAAMQKNIDWATSEAGRPIVNELADALLNPNVRRALLEEDKKQRMIALAFQRADGIRMTQQVLDSLANSPWQGTQIEGLGSLLFDDGLKKIMGDDFMVKLSPDGTTLAFGEQFLAKVLNELDPASLGHLKQTWENIRAARAAGRAARSKRKGKAANPKAPVNKAKKQTQDEIGENAQKLAEDEVANDPNVRVDSYSPEEGIIARTFYNELKYGSVVGGLSKILSKVSDRATMSSKGKTVLVSAEHVRLESSGTIMAGLRILNDAINQDAARANKIFETIKANLRTDEKSIEDVIGLLDPADRAAGQSLIEYIDAIFGIGDTNALMRNGMFFEDLAPALDSVGLGDMAAWARSRGALEAEEALDYWRQIEPAEGQNVLDVIGKFYAAQQIAAIPPTMSHSLVRHFSHLSANEKISYDDALRQGWFALDQESLLGKYMDYGEKQRPLFPPEMKGRIEAMEGYLSYDRAKNINQLIRYVDQATSILKSSITIWRPGHHMVSMMGNVAMNGLAGVGAYDYAMGFKAVTRRFKINDVDDAALNELMRLQAPAGTQLKGELLDRVKVGNRTLSIDDIVLAAERTGVFINPRRVRDVVTTDDLGSGAFSTARKLSNKPGAKQVLDVDHKLAEFSAYRDNVARLPLFIKELRNSTAKSLDDAFLEAAAKVHEFHPTVGTLTAPERRVARRLFYFYTWQKQAFFKILEVTANKPALVTVPSKLQFAIATSQGLDPQSFGDPYSAHGWFAGYNMGSTYGPQWVDGEWGAMGVKPPIPQLDVIDSYLSGIQVQPGLGLYENLGNLASSAWQQVFVQQASPLFKIPAELSIGRRVTTGQQITNIGEYAIDQTGFGTLSRIYDWTPWGPRSDTDLDPYSMYNRERLWWNYLSGLKITAYESPTALRVARQEAIDYYNKINKTGQYAPRLSLAEWQQIQKERNE